MVTVVVGAPAGLRGLDVGGVAERVLRVVFFLIAAMSTRPGASVTRSRAASVEDRSLMSGVTGTARWPVAPMRSLVSLTSPMSPRTIRARRDPRQWLGRCHGRLQSPAQPVRRGVQRSCLLACDLPLCECGPIGPYEAAAGLSTCSHHWRKLVGVEFSAVRWTPLSRPSFFAQAMSVYP